MKIAIVGAGISGLSAAHFILKKNPNCEITVFERNDRPGGNIRTEVHSGFIFEFGPRHIKGSDRDSLEMIEDLGLWPEIIVSQKNAKTHFVYHDNSFEEIPKSVTAFLRSPLLEKPLKTIMNEYKTEPIDIYDSIKTFSFRHFGKEFTNRVTDPYITGKYYGDIAKMSTNAVLADLKEYERSFGSVIKGIMKNKQNQNGVYSENIMSIKDESVVSFKGGLQFLIDSIIEHHQLNVIYNQQVKMVRQGNDKMVEMVVNDSVYKFDKVIMTTPSYVSAHLLRDCDEEFYRALGLIKYAPLAAVNLAFEEDLIKHDAFGYHVPVSENQRMISCIYNHKIFPEHSPGSRANLTVLLGGPQDFKIMEKPAHMIIKTALKHLENHLEITEEPIVVRIRQYSRAIPQYNMGVEKVWERMDAVSEKYENIILASNYRHGIQFKDCVKLSKKIANSIS